MTAEAEIEYRSAAEDFDIAAVFAVDTAADIVAGIAVDIAPEFFEVLPLMAVGHLENCLALPENFPALRRLAVEILPVIFLSGFPEFDGEVLLKTASADRKNIVY